MCWGASTIFTGNRLSPEFGRQFGREQLGEMLVDLPGRDELIQDASLVISELLTNSLRAGSQTTRLGLALHRDILRVMVDDIAPGRPAPRTAGHDDTTGRGMTIVAALSIALAVEDLIPGKRVWADMAVDPPLTTNLRNCNRSVRPPTTLPQATGPGSLTTTHAR